MRAHMGTAVFRVAGRRMLVPYHRPAVRAGRRVPAVLFLHGFPGAEKSVDVQRELLRRGIASAAPRFLGAWGSGGSYRFTTLVSQARAALRAMRRMDFVDPRRVAVYGFSMGGWTAVNLGALEPSLKAVAAVSPAGGPEMLGPRTRDFLAAHAKVLTAPAPGALLADFRRALTRYDPAKAAPRLRVPLLLVHGDADETVPAGVSRRLAALAGGRATLVIERGADHGYLDRRDKLAKRVASWLEERL